MKFLVRWLPMAAIGLVIGCSSPPEEGVFVPEQGVTPRSEEALLTVTIEAVTDPFREGVNKAMAAAELTQTAQTSEEWIVVEGWWGEAVKAMGAVPTLSEHYGTAQIKVVEYQKNREYAQEQAQRAEQTLIVQ